MVDLTDKADKQVRTYSGGMKRRLEIARGLLHHPDVLFLDEPTLGLDPQTRRHIWDYLLDLRDREGITLLMTTHYIDEAENCDRVAIIDHGNIVALNTPEALKEGIGGDLITVSTEDNERAAEVLGSKFELEVRRNAEGEVILETAGGGAFVPKLIDTLSRQDPQIPVTNVSVRRPTLEDVFVRQTGRAIREQGGDQERENMRQRMRMRRG
jgi:ABC-2 type transport system ATP-binding protein